MSLLSKTDEPEQDVEVTRDDQKKINTFSILTSRLQELERQLTVKSKQKQNMEDAETDIMMLDDDEERIPYRIGEVYVQLTNEEVQERLEADKAKIDAELDEIGHEVSEIKATLNRLKVDLYAKFGKAINLELD